MRVALVHPHLFHHPAPSLPSGLAWLGAALRARGHHVRLLDLSFVWNRSSAIPGFVTAFRPDVVALGVPYLDNECAFHALSFLPATRWVADALRAASRAPIVAGGWGVTWAPSDVLRYLGLSLGFVGGDLARASEWIEAVGHGDLDADVPGAARWDGAAYRATPPDSDPAGLAADPAAAAHDLLDLTRHEAHGGSAVVAVALPRGAAMRRREPAEVDHEVGVLRTISTARRVLFAGWCVGREGLIDDALLERLAMRGPTLAWEMYAEPEAVTRERLGVARRAGVRALRLEVGDGAELDGPALALAQTPRDLAVLLEVRIGGPRETPGSLARKLATLRNLRHGPTRIVLRPGARLWEPASGEVLERRSGAAGDSYVWPRFGFAELLEGTLRESLTDVATDRAGTSLDSDAYAPWQRFAHAFGRRSGIWPAWRLDSHLADLGKHLRGALIERVPFRNQPR